MKLKFGTKLIAKTFSYRINAVIDSYISRGVLQRIYDEELDDYSEEVVYRINEFERVAKKTSNPRAFLVGVAFTQYFANGYWDILYPKFFERRFKRLFNKKVKKILYEHFKSISVEPYALGIFNTDWWEYLGIINESFRDLRKKSLDKAEKNLLRVQKLNYTSKKEIEVKGSLRVDERTAFLLGVVIVNKLNKIHNAHVASMSTGKGTDEKIELFGRVSKEFGRGFMESALNTQTAAGWWDKQFIRGFKLRFRDVFRRKDIKRFIEQEVRNYSKRLSSN